MVTWNSRSGSTGEKRSCYGERSVRNDDGRGKTAPRDRFSLPFGQQRAPAASGLEEMRIRSGGMEARRMC